MTKLAVEKLLSWCTSGTSKQAQKKVAETIAKYQLNYPNKTIGQDEIVMLIKEASDSRLQ